MLKADLYRNIIDVIHAEDSNNNVSHHIILSSLFTGNLHQIYQLYQDVIFIVSYFRKSDFFVTFICNPKWPKVIR